MKEFWIGVLIGLPIAVSKLILYFKYKYDTTKKGVYKTLSPLAILLGVIYAFFDEK